MDGAAGEETTKALPIGAIDADGAPTRASVPSVEQQRPAPLPAAGLAASTDGGSAAAVQSHSEEVDDEQVERFYALLADIRALRGLYSAGDGGGSGSPAGQAGRKRVREAEAPWRPAFRMEDFEFEEEVSQVTADARCAVKKQQGASGAGAKRHAPGAGGARAADDHHEEDQVAEARGNKLGRRVAAQG